MSEPKVGIITKVEDGSYGDKSWKVVTLGTGEVLKVKSGKEGVLRAKWGLLEVGVGMKFTMMDYTLKDGTKAPYVYDIETVAGALPTEGGSTEMLKEHKAVIAEATKEVTETPPKPPETPVAPQELGMWYKEAGELYRMGFLKDDNPVEKKIKQKYFNRLFKVLGIDVQY